ncbi:HEAT repeat domain-containing protein [Solicola gregarius]|uniref:HEAT repeat domain-containing protein n=1 Tax=Solicola gregarius TaxID=2908642 RepID=A0AA46YLR5_9ACTN|nr:HEAT repeat domain-containing protein [Solicola gregarius]UYM05128.1 HEAT repeat domain-containing protein [Solicola gregarius]
MARTWGMTPRQSILAECRLRGPDAVVAGCVAILDRAEVDADLVRALAGPAAEGVLAGREGGPNGYWPRVWAVRGLLHVYDAGATPSIVTATEDDAWRVREMAAKVVARHRVADAFDAMVVLRDDRVARVRRAAERALVELTADEA